MFSDQDIKSIERHGLRVVDVERQIENFRNGFPYLPIVAAAAVGNGIMRLTEQQVRQSQALYNDAAQHLRVVKFVPASGAATRMFKELFEFLSTGVQTAGIAQLTENIRDFAFYPELCNFVADFTDARAVVENVITKGLCYGSKPKGLVTFHAYTEGARKAFEEHLVEGALYGCSEGKVHIHFTVSPEHRAEFEKLMHEKVPVYAARFGVEYDISFSEQKPSTDTIAVNPDNTPFRTDAGELLFRPAGHGALIENLNDIEADIIFVKNIDNVTTDRLKGDTVTYKKALAGVLLEHQHSIFEMLARIDAGTVDAAQVAQYIVDTLPVRLPEVCDMALLRSLLDRPIRVCGVVRNEGEPGGGPFWVRDERGVESLQIAESSQIAPDDMPLMREATHFNPVDLVCGVRRADGSKFDLTLYTDPSTGFISSKSSGGRELRAQELPGLWNGAMADWTTLFVEVPISTFSPVKTVQDLLREQHR